MTWLVLMFVGVPIVMLIGWALEKPPPRDPEFDDDWP
jgi:hypothetical protein